MTPTITIKHSSKTNQYWVFKFRAWHKERKEMYDVHGWHSEYCFKDTLDGVGCAGNPDTLSDVILMQYTGLKDKNGKEIYEGDVLRCCDQALCEVIYREDRAQFQIKWITPMWASVRGKQESIFPNIDVVGEIIGNIYENQTGGRMG